MPAAQQPGETNPETPGGETTPEGPPESTGWYPAGTVSNRRFDGGVDWSNPRAAEGPPDGTGAFVNSFGAASDAEIRLVWPDADGGTDSSPADRAAPGNWPTGGYQGRIYGSPNDLWGATSQEMTDYVTTEEFGVIVRAASGTKSTSRLYGRRYGISIHPDVEVLGVEVRVTRDLFGGQTPYVTSVEVRITHTAKPPPTTYAETSTASVRPGGASTATKNKGYHEVSTASVRPSASSAVRSVLGLISQVSTAAGASTGGNTAAHIVSRVRTTVRPSSVAEIVRPPILVSGPVTSRLGYSSGIRSAQGFAGADPLPSPVSMLHGSGTDDIGTIGATWTGYGGGPEPVLTPDGPALRYAGAEWMKETRGDLGAAIRSGSWSGVTIAARVRPSDLAGSIPFIWDVGFLASAGVGLGYRNDRGGEPYCYLSRFHGGNSFNAAPALAAGAWADLAMTVGVGGPSRLRLYRDGALIGDGYVNVDALDGDSVGADTPTVGWTAKGQREDRRFRGDMRHVSVFDRALTPQELAAHFASPLAWTQPPADPVALTVGSIRSELTLHSYTYAESALDGRRVGSDI